jgi:hypothetical protein
MKGYPEALKSVMTGATLASLLVLGGAKAEAREVPVARSMTRQLQYESVRSELGDNLYACWKKSQCVAATSPVGWQKEMERVQGELCVLPAPDAPKHDWASTGLLVVSYSQGSHLSSDWTLNVRGVSRTGDRLLVEAALSPRTDGCGTCDQDEVRLARRDLAGVKTVQVVYTDESMGGASLAAESYSVSGTEDAVSYLVSWGSMKSMYR